MTREQKIHQAKREFDENGFAIIREFFSPQEVFFMFCFSVSVASKSEMHISPFLFSRFF